MPTAASPPGVLTFPQADRWCDRSCPRYSSHSGQLQHSQASPSKEVVPRTSSLSPALYPDQRLLAESGRTLVCRDHTQTYPPRDLSLRARVGQSHPGLYPRKQQESETVPMGGERQHHYSQGKKV